VSFRARLERVTRALEAAASAGGRDPSSVRLVAVSKSFGADRISEALEAGVTDFGENRAQELAHKAAALGAGPRWHFVGHLQTNKVRLVAGRVELIHSLDTRGLADALERRAAALEVVQEVLIEVNISGEPQKHGAEPAGLVELAEAVSSLRHLRLKGLMTIPPRPRSPEDSRPFYRRLATLGADVAAATEGATELSMGMSGDFEVAVQEGATLVRVGEALFGPRRSASR
jgi:PLP dependent protein